MSAAKKVAEILPWKQEYSVGIANFDGDHRAFVRFINKFHEAMMLGRSREVLEDVLDRFIKGAREHFRSEEHVMQAHAYPGYQVHKAEHLKFLHTMMRFQKDYHAGKTLPTIDFMMFLRDWFSNHSQGTDQRYVPFLKKKRLA